MCILFLFYLTAHNPNLSGLCCFSCYNNVPIYICIYKSIHTKVIRDGKKIEKRQYITQKGRPFKISLCLQFIACTPFVFYLHSNSKQYIYGIGMKGEMARILYRLTCSFKKVGRQYIS